ncbi:hypothetical protein [Corynebacterium auriscanis]|uniref:Uncharacterized protein n=1 Tax=Corynebacterium auriscanis TaxID=99807 RepID=A0A0A2DK32_9CORY|nr:hypothetical protein [Corynebacterium auriscanis]KGM18132.1 hypothetical protein MA47_09515 [Corynebacterium auriscanis]WJY73196.1 hypothetical protein CAURIC_07905 [Corynebacterium auriscanis]
MTTNNPHYRWSANTIQNQLGILEKNLNTTKQQTAMNRHNYSDQGYQDVHNRATQTHRNRLANLNTAIDQWETAAKKPATKLRAELLPTAKHGSNEAVQAELQAQRYMNRTTFDLAGATKIFELPPSPTRTILLEEAQAAGAFTGGSFEALLRESSPDYREATRTADYAATTATILRKRTEGLNRIATHPDRTKLEPTETINTETIPGSDTEYLIDPGIGLDTPTE